jgi:uncharacterized protein (DUF488 family)
VRVFTIGHGARPAEELITSLRAAGVRTLVDVRRFPSSRRHPQHDGRALAATLSAAGVGYQHEVELGGRRTREPGEERFRCLETPAFRSYAARMARREWQDALARALAAPVPCFMCAETAWWRCHRRLIAELLTAYGHEVVHLLRPHEARPHVPLAEVETRAGKLYLCGELVA